MLILNKSSKGYILLELILCFSIITFSVSFVTLGYSYWQNYYYKSQVRMITNLLATDLRYLQQNNLFQGDKALLVLKIYSSKDAYGIYSGYINGALKKKVVFSKLGCKDVYFQSYIARVSFNNNGVPSVIGFYVLKHKKLPGYMCQLTLQPVTGRVSFYESK